jgi:glycosyltransferase involved in cell wall biosynthesis
MSDKVCRRVLMLASEYPPNVFGGLGTHVHAITTALSSTGVEVELLLPPHKTYDGPSSGVRLHEVAVSRSESSEQFWLQFCLRVVEHAEGLARNCDVIHCHDWMTVVAGMALRKRTGVPLIFSVHLPQEIGANLTMENLGLAWADCVLVNSRAVAQELASRAVPWKGLRVIPNGVDSSRFTPAEAVAPDEKYILFVGRLVAQKGVDVALRAFDTLRHLRSDIRLLIVGEGENSLLLLRLARSLGVIPSVTFAGWRRGQALVDAYQCAELVLMPSLYEPFGIVALEAMACGKPVIASSVGGLTEIIEHGVTGFLSPPGEYLSFAQHMANVLLNPELASAMGRAARQRALQFSWERAAEDTVRCYEQVLSDYVSAPLADIRSLDDKFILAVAPEAASIAKQLVTDQETIASRNGGNLHAC